MRQESANFNELLAEESRHVTLALHNSSPTPIVVKMSSVELQCPFCLWMWRKKRLKSQTPHPRAPRRMPGRP